MTLLLILALVWLVAANLIGMVPSKKKHWPQAYAMIALGLPLLCWVFWDNGAVIGLLVLLAACSILRWPVVFFVRWLRGLVGGQGALPPSP